MELLSVRRLGGRWGQSSSCSTLAPVPVWAGNSGMLRATSSVAATNLSSGWEYGNRTYPGGMGKET